MVIFTCFSSDGQECSFFGLAVHLEGQVQVPDACMVSSSHHWDSWSYQRGLSRALPILQTTLCPCSTLCLQTPYPHPTYLAIFYTLIWLYVLWEEGLFHSHPLYNSPQQQQTWYISRILNRASLEHDELKFLKKKKRFGSNSLKDKTS